VKFENAQRPTPKGFASRRLDIRLFSYSLNRGTRKISKNGRWPPVDIAKLLLLQFLDADRDIARIGNSDSHLTCAR
jgi:hypothetical protein